GETYDQQFAGIADGARDNSQHQSDYFLTFSLSRSLLAIDPHPNLPPSNGGRKEAGFQSAIAREPPQVVSFNLPFLSGAIKAGAHFGCAFCNVALPNVNFSRTDSTAPSA